MTKPLDTSQDSIDSQGTSSVGPSRQISTKLYGHGTRKRWNQFYFQNDDLTDSTCTIVASPGITMSFSLHGQDDEVLRKRIFGCLLLYRMPQEGLQEAMMSLADILDYYRERARVTAPAPTVESHYGIITSTGVRPELTLYE